MRKHILAAVLAICLGLPASACIETGGNGNGPEERVGLLFYSALAVCFSLDNCFDDAFTGRTGSLTITSTSGSLLYERETGTLTSESYEVIFSASKWITAAVIMAATVRMRPRVSGASWRSAAYSQASFSAGVICSIPSSA